MSTVSPEKVADCSAAMRLRSELSRRGTKPGPPKSSADAFQVQGGEQEGGRGEGSPALPWSRERPEPSLGGRRGTFKFTSSFVLSVGVVAFNRHPVPVPRHLLPVPVLFQVKFSEHRAVL